MALVPDQAHRRVLFLCTGNYYRSRFAELYFNHLAESRGLPWRAESRGLATETNYLLPGVISPLTCAALAARGVALPGQHRDPIAACASDFAGGFARVIALKETEHRPLMAARFPEHESSVEYWEVHDIHDAPADETIAELERRVRRLVDELTVASERNPTGDPARPDP